jgi:hypothetical protein
MKKNQRNKISKKGNEKNCRPRRRPAANMVLQQVGLDKETSTNCKSKLQFGLDKQTSTIVQNFKNNILI